MDALKLGVKEVPTLVGMKYSAPDVITLGLIAEGVKNFKIFCGFEDVCGFVICNCPDSISVLYYIDTLPDVQNTYHNALFDLISLI